MPILVKKIIFPDEAHIDLGGYVNKQNYRIWGTEDPHTYIENPTHPKHGTVWCRFWFRSILKLFFFENGQEEVVTVNDDRYRAMLNEFLFIKIEEKVVGNTWFQQDSATCHTAEATLDVLRSVFKDRFINRRADVVWLTCSCDLRRFYYYLWGAVKDKCYADKPKTIDALKANAWPAAELMSFGQLRKMANYSDGVFFSTKKCAIFFQKMQFRVCFLKMFCPLKGWYVLF